MSESILVRAATAAVLGAVLILGMGTAAAEPPVAAAAETRRALDRGDRAWKRSCRRPQRDLCLRFRPVRGRTCLDGQKLRVEVVRQKRFAERAAARYRKALELYADSAGFAGLVGEEAEALRARVDRARLRLAALEQERLASVMTPPEIAGLAGQGAEKRRANNEYKAWLQKGRKAAAAAGERFAALAREGGDPRTAALAARGMGDTLAMWSYSILVIEIPAGLETDEDMAIYCKMLLEQASPVARQAERAYERCRAFAEELDSPKVICRPLEPFRVGELAERRVP